MEEAHRNSDRKGSAMLPLNLIESNFEAHTNRFEAAQCLMIASMIPYFWFTIGMLFIIGILGGIFVIPLNTMLQEAGKDAIGSGKTIAVQNMTEQGLTVIGLTLTLP
jgi:hypothetical protein